MCTYLAEYTNYKKCLVCSAVIWLKSNVPCMLADDDFSKTTFSRGAKGKRGWMESNERIRNAPSLIHPVNEMNERSTSCSS